MTLLDTLLGEKPKGTLYHYTSTQGLLGILKKGAIWATHINYLNDESEFTHGMILVRKVISERLLAADDNEKNYYNTIIRQIDSLNILVVPSIFVSSFCESGDELALWRGYCPHSSGYALGYNWNQDMDEKSVIARCIYNDEKIMKSISEELDKYMHIDTTDIQKRYANTRVPKNLPEYEWRSIAFVERMYFFSPAFKKSSYKEEKEWRLIVMHPITDLSKEKYRPGETMVIPYVEHSLLNKGSLHIDKIVVGPTNHPIHAAHAVERYIKRFSNEKEAFQINCDEVVISEIPYRRV